MYIPPFEHSDALEAFLIKNKVPADLWPPTLVEGFFRDITLERCKLVFRGGQLVRYVRWVDVCVYRKIGQMPMILAEHVPANTERPASLRAQMDLLMRPIDGAVSTIDGAFPGVNWRSSPPELMEEIGDDIRAVGTYPGLPSFGPVWRFVWELPPWRNLSIPFKVRTPWFSNELEWRRVADLGDSSLTQAILYKAKASPHVI